MPKAYYQVKNRMPLIIKAMNESIAKTWSNEMGLGIIAATTYFDKISTFKNSTFKNKTFKPLIHF
ncbi:hypothetical protein I6E84_05880 [Psychrobacter sp. SCQQ22]|uniref:hypothetical protein n=1 Tax=unclassified Psychrobacter TaxID=196806 RepID=UPI0018CE835E|nr:hypothetical protein [Psychrobacter sp. SCQQ22]MBH0085746.1 hypothetical protein [Psychrobacter sp. SCQQ22]